MKIKNKFIIKKIKSKKLRKKINNLNLNRLIINRTSRHIYAKILSLDGKKIEVSASTSEKNIYKYLNKNNIYSGNKKSSKIIGKIIAIRSIRKNISKVYLDRSGLKYHGRIKVLADNSRLYGLIF